MYWVFDPKSTDTAFEKIKINVPLLLQLSLVYVLRELGVMDEKTESRDAFIRVLLTHEEELVATGHTCILWRGNEDSGLTPIFEWCGDIVCAERMRLRTEPRWGYPGFLLGHPGTMDPNDNRDDLPALESGAPPAQGSFLY